MTFYEKFVQIELCLPWASNSTTTQNIIELDISNKKAAVSDSHVLFTASFLINKAQGIIIRLILLWPITNLTSFSLVFQFLCVWSCRDTLLVHLIWFNKQTHPFHFQGRYLNEAQDAIPHYFPNPEFFRIIYDFLHFPALFGVFRI